MPAAARRTGPAARACPCAAASSPHPAAAPGPQKWLATWSRSIRCSRSARNRVAIASITSTVLRCVASTAVRSIVSSSASAPGARPRRRRDPSRSDRRDGRRTVRHRPRAQGGFELQQLHPIAVGEVAGAFGVVHRLPSAGKRRSQQAQGSCAVDLECRPAHEARGPRNTGRSPPCRTRRGRPAAGTTELGDPVGGVQAGAREVQRDAVIDQVLGGGLGPRPQAGARGVRVGEVGIGCFTAFEVIRQMRPQPAARRWGRRAPPDGSTSACSR